MTLKISALATLALLHAAPAMAADPPVPAGKDPGGTAVALFTTGIDYTLPEVARVLARDGEGELIGWDVVDNDRRPFAPIAEPESSNGTAIAKLFVGESVRLVPVRVDRADPMSLARAAAFVARTPAQVAILPQWSERREDWEPFRQVALKLKDIVFIATAGSGASADPASLGIANLVATAPETCRRRDQREDVASVLNVLCRGQRKD